MAKLSSSLVLNKYILNLFGVTDLEALSLDLKDFSLEGYDENNISHFHHALVGSFYSNQNLTKDILLRYDQNIYSHTQSISEKRNEPIKWKYFQYLALLFTEIYLDKYFTNKDALLIELNEFLEFGHGKHGNDFKAVSEFKLEPNLNDLNKLAYWNATGSGKTTLSTLLLRLFDPTKGVIILDEIDLRDYKLADLRSQYAVVHQETVLFSTTVAENISFARPNATMDEVIAAATAAKAHEFITSLPNGYDTLVGERGMKLSGGERQRISLARAFLKDAPILILDEPTSSLDVHTEAAILDTIQELMKGRTTLMIAHRPSTLRDCNMILVLEDGRVSRMTDEVESVISDMQAVRVQA